MKIKRFCDKDMRHVLRQVRLEQGPDAVILSNRRVDDGIEVIAATDYDEALIHQAVGSESAIDFLQQMAEDGAPPSQQAADGAADSTNADAIVDAKRSLMPASSDQPSSADTGDTALEDLNSEVKSMRDLLETQLSGLLWKDASRQSPMRAQMLRNLSQLGIAPDIANMIVNRVGSVDDSKNLWRAPLMELAQLIPTKDDALLEEGGIAALIGPTGVGKTTTIAKMAVQYAMKYGSDKVSLISADAFRIGAREHLLAFANIIGVGVHAANDFNELEDLLNRLKSQSLVLIDTEGRSQRDRELTNQLAAYGTQQDRVRFYLTLSATCQQSGLNEVVQRFNELPLRGAILTKIDETGQLGCALSTLIRNDLPITWLTDGQRVPDDLHKAAKKKLWLVNQAMECMEYSGAEINERLMAENFREVSDAVQA